MQMIHSTYAVPQDFSTHCKKCGKEMGKIMVNQGKGLSYRKLQIYLSTMFYFIKQGGKEKRIKGV